MKTRLAIAGATSGAGRGNGGLPTRAAFMLRAGALWFAAGPSTALAHGAERGLVLLLPTGYAIAGGVVVVALSFALFASLPERRLRALAAWRLAVARAPGVSANATSLLSFAVLAALCYAGLHGAADPLSNPLPLFVWTAWWVGFTLLQAVTGDLWPYLNPWSGPLAVVRRALNVHAPLWRYPRLLGYAPAAAAFFGFAWFELVSPAPEDPRSLGVAVGVYWLYGLAGCLAFGQRQWFEKAEPFAIFFRLVGACAPLQRASDRGRLVLALPGARCPELPPLPPSGVAFVLLTLSSVSFDGFSKTFAWLAATGVNPLEFPGRSGVAAINSLGLIGAFAVLSALFLAGCRLAATIVGARTADLAGRLVYALVPISIAFHFSHYLPALLVNGQYLMLAVNDPLASGHGLAALADAHVTTSFLNRIETVRAIWTAQTVAIVAGHVVAMAVSHAVALEASNDARRAVVGMIPLTGLMLAYTGFGLWLLSTASIG